MKVKVPFHVAYIPPWRHGQFEFVVFAFQMVEHWIGEYSWDYCKVQAVPIEMKYAVRLGEE